MPDQRKNLTALIKGRIAIEPERPLPVVSAFSGSPLGIASPVVSVLHSVASEPAVATLPRSSISAVAEATAPTRDAHPLPFEHALEHAIPQIHIRKRAVVKRLCETLPALITLAVISFLFWGPIFAPVPFVAAVLVFHSYWTYRILWNNHKRSSAP